MPDHSNSKILLDIAAAIEREDNAAVLDGQPGPVGRKSSLVYDQSTWFEIDDFESGAWDKHVVPLPDSVFPDVNVRLPYSHRWRKLGMVPVEFMRQGQCQTRACIAGHAVLLDTSTSRWFVVGDRCGYWELLPELRHLVVEKADHDDENGPVYKLRHMEDVAAKLIGRNVINDDNEGINLFDECWRPYDDVPTALRQLARGASLADVTELG